MAGSYRYKDLSTYVLSTRNPQPARTTILQYEKGTLIELRSVMMLLIVHYWY